MYTRVNVCINCFYFYFWYLSTFYIWDEEEIEEAKEEEEFDHI